MNTDSKRFRALLFGSIYFIEGAILTYFSGFNALYLRSFNVSYTQIGVAGGIALLPFVLKIFIGMLSDKVNLAGLGHRKPFMIIGILLQGVGLLLAPLVNPVTSFPVFIAILLLVSLGMSTYDTCSDGLAIDTTPTEERGFVQGVMVGARALAAIVLAAAIGFLAARVSWTAAFFFIAVLIFGVAFGYYETVYMAAGMDFADPRIAATMFAIIMAVGNIGIGAGQPLAGVLVDSTGFRGLFIILSLINLATLPLVPIIFKGRDKTAG